MKLLIPPTLTNKSLSIAVVGLLSAALLFLIHPGGWLHDIAIRTILPLFEISIPEYPDTYDDATHPIFPPLYAGQHDSCSNFPKQWLDKVQVVLKTGVAFSEQTEAYLASVASCTSNLLVFSDLSEQFQGHEIIDALEKLPKEYTEHPDFHIYHQQREAYSAGQKVQPSREGWKLDRFKFLPMVEAAYRMRPNSSWYVFLEVDVYIFWDNIFRLLEQYNPKDRHYFGTAVAGSHGRWFAYGGAGFVLSQALMHDLVAGAVSLTSRYREWVLTDCCGDAVLGYAILDKTGMRVEDFYPMFSGETVEGLGVNKQRWCNPLISLYRVSVESLNSLWHWERSRPTEKTPLAISDLLAYRQSHLWNTSTAECWDNLSGDADQDAGHSLLACAEACQRSQKCLQYSYRPGACRLSPYIFQGHAVDCKDAEITSGWNLKRLEQFGLGAPGCEVAKWTKPVIHRCGLVNCA